MNNKAIWFIVVVVIVAAALWWMKAGRAPAPVAGTPAGQQPAASLQAEVNAVDTGSTDADFQAIDKDLNAL